MLEIKIIKMNLNKFNENLKINVWHAFFFLWNKQQFLLWLNDANNGKDEK